MTGSDYARRHIEQAEQFSAEVAYTDQIVKDYFFNLDRADLDSLLFKYEQAYGHAKRQYAQQTIAAWRSGQRRMSGVVAQRLFELLPPRMPASDKFKIAETLWTHYGPSSRKLLFVGLDADLSAVLSAVRSYFDKTITEEKIPRTLESRFDWLTQNDVKTKLKILAALREADKLLAVEMVGTRLPILLEHLVEQLKADGGKHHTRLSHVAIVGKHELQIFLSRSQDGFAFADADIRYAIDHPRPDSQRLTLSQLARGLAFPLFWIAVILVAWIVHSH